MGAGLEIGFVLGAGLAGVSVGAICCCCCVDKDKKDEVMSTDPRKILRNFLDQDFIV